MPSALLRLPLPVLAHCCPCLSALHCSCLSAPSGTMEQQSATTSIFILLAHCNAYLHFSAVAFAVSRTMEHQSSTTKTRPRSKHQGVQVSANLQHRRNHSGLTLPHQQSTHSYRIQTFMIYCGHLLSYVNAFQISSAPPGDH